MANITQAQIESAILTTAETVLRNELYFCDLDGLAGDGDFGNSLATGFKVIKADLPGMGAPDIGAMLMKLAMIVSKHVGGSSGPIWGTGFMKAAALAKGKTDVSLEELAAMVGAAVDGIMARGGAVLGDKTLLDALIPVREKLAEMAASAAPGEALAACAAVADGAVDSTRHLVAHRGRASQVGERSANTPDPGIVAIAAILADWCKASGIAFAPHASEVAKATA
jgi:phosphoenolpyruvate---glycerone phosphotransferase subunit DhaL